MEVESGERGRKGVSHFVLVHGACHGAWCWQKLSDLLKKAGHLVTAVDLGGTGINPKDDGCIRHCFRTTPLQLIDQIGELKKLVEEGKIKYIGLFEASASIIRRAHVVHPITTMQLEWSLCTRDAGEEIIPTCRELGIGIVPYNPLGRGFLSAGPKMLENLADTDFRKTLSPSSQLKLLEASNSSSYRRMFPFCTEMEKDIASKAWVYICIHIDFHCLIFSSGTGNQLHMLCMTMVPFLGTSLSQSTLKTLSSTITLASKECDTYTGEASDRECLPLEHVKLYRV